MLALSVALCAFSPPTLSSVPHSRRDFIGHALCGAVGASSAGLALLPQPVLAVAPPSPQQILKSRAVYGSRGAKTGL